MKNYCMNTGLDAQQSFLNRDAALTLRSDVDQYLNKKIDVWNQTVPYAQHFEGKEINKTYYTRHLMETIWRIRLMRIIGAKALVAITQKVPLAAQIWANYEMEEMIHDELFFQDLKKQGVSKEEVLATSPYLSTKLLSGYFSYLLDHEGPLGVIAYSYLVEHVSGIIEEKKLAAMKQSLGEEVIKGQLAHAHTDVQEDHPGEVWQVIRYLISSQDDIEKLYRYLDECQEILAMYFRELYEDTIVHSSEAMAA